MNVPYHEDAGLIVSVDSTATDRLPDLVEVLEQLDRETADER